MKHKHQWLSIGLALGLALWIGHTGFAQTQGAESPEVRDARMAWWREARFGMFIHWGLFSAGGGVWNGQQTPGIACSMQSHLFIPPDEYATLTNKFTGEHFDPVFIARLAKETGMKYVIPIAKHHEGFCLYDSKLTDFKITNTPAKRDWIRETLDAVRAEGLHTGIYYSLLDWKHPGYPVDKFHPMRKNAEFAARPRDWENYLRYMHGQVEELMTGYGKIDIFWPDFSYGEMHGEKWQATGLMSMIRRHQPQIITNNRLELDKTPINPKWGMDFQTPEQEIPPTGIPGQDWETCQTLNRTWEYTHYDRDWKSPTTLIQQLIDTVSKGGNYLLNIGPKPDGSVPQSTIDTLHTIGGWMKVNGESIYGTTANPFPNGVPWGRCTLKRLPNGNARLYFHIFKWPWNARLQIPSLENEITSAWLLSDPAHPKLPFSKDAEGGIVVELPTAEVNDYATVVAVDLRGDVRLGASSKVVSGQTKILYRDDFKGAIGAATTTVPKISPPGFVAKSELVELDGSGHLTSTNPLSPTANYCFRLDTKPLTGDPSIASIKYTAVLRMPTNDWIGIGFQGTDMANMTAPKTNSGPCVLFAPTYIDICGGSSTKGGNQRIKHYTPASMITAEMTCHVADKTLDLSINGSSIVRGFVLNHKFPDDTPSDPVVWWTQIQFFKQPDSGKGGGYVDSLQIETLSKLTGDFSGSK